MFRNYKSLLIICIIFTLASCQGDDDDTTVYFGGEITNPRTPYIILSKNNKFADTIKLDKNNRFFVKYDSLAPGMYNFKHGTDYQFVYFDRNDSIMLSVNTANFDESVVFSGRGNEKNNFMMELYLKNEEDRNQMYNVYSYDYNSFIKNIDATYSKRKKFYEEGKKKINWSDGFDFFGRARLNLNYYTKKEYYPYLHDRRTGENIIAQLPGNYYDFRKEINLDNTEFIGFSPYMRYLSGMLNNRAYSRKGRVSNLENNVFNDNIAKLRIADTLFKNEQVKNDVLNNVAFGYLIEDQNTINNQKFLSEYLERSTDDSKENEIRNIAKGVKSLKEGNKLPQIKLVDVNNKYYDINNVNKKTVIFFWTSCARARLSAIYDKVKDLKEEYPDVNFIAVNVDYENEWKKTLSLYPYNDALQLRAYDLETLKDKWALTKINRTIILNPDGSIKNAFTNLMDPKFSTYLN
ncbi:TlpA family protein disulfide reductase [Flavobacterium rhizosphaerae]|uniref:Thioredoxin-like domain-containing protein n=1 Tax=Flavobacterium rhizosphaerae TaxID=3163298 RepID=A0ABW8YW03_9FLAO